MSVSKYQILQEVRKLVPLAAEQLKMMLEDPRTPPALRKQLIEMALQYGLGKKKVYDYPADGGRRRGAAPPGRAGSRRAEGRHGAGETVGRKALRFHGQPVSGFHDD